MAESSSWKDAKTKMWARIKEIEKDVHDYDYSETHRMMATDDRLKDHLLKELRKSKKILFNIIEDSYEQQKEGLTNDLHKIRDEVDVLLDEMKVTHADKWPESIPQEFLEKIVTHDSEMLRAVPKLNSMLEEAHKQILNMEKPGTGLFDRQEFDRLNARSKAIKDMVAGLVKLFRERELLINLRHIHREQEYEELRDGMETTY